MLNRIRVRHIALMVMLAVVSGLAIFFYSSDQDRGGDYVMRPYDEAKDFQPLVKLMKDNLFWISETHDFQPEKMLALRAPNYDPRLAGTVKVEVIETDQKTAGFIAYYKKSPEHGYIWLLGVDSTFRGRGFGERLVKKALDDFKAQHVSYVTLATRIINKPALSLYYKFGFKEISREEDRGMIFLIKRGL